MWRYEIHVALSIRRQISTIFLDAVCKKTVATLLLETDIRLSTVRIEMRKYGHVLQSCITVPSTIEWYHYLQWHAYCNNFYIYGLLHTDH